MVVLMVGIGEVMVRVHHGLVPMTMAVTDIRRHRWFVQMRMVLIVRVLMFVLHGRMCMAMVVVFR
jgi:hypothetical protein